MWVVRMDNFWNLGWLVSDVVVAHISAGLGNFQTGISMELSLCEWLRKNLYVTMMFACLIAEDVMCGWRRVIFELNWDDLGRDPSLFTVKLAGGSSRACVGLGGCCSAGGSQQKVCLCGAGGPYLPHSHCGTSFGPLLVFEKSVKIGAAWCLLIMSFFPPFMMI